MKSYIYASVAHVAQGILIIPASSTPVKIVFSKAGYTLSGRRNQLASTILENEILLKTNKQ